MQTVINVMGHKTDTQAMAKFGKDVEQDLGIHAAAIGQVDAGTGCDTQAT